METAGERKVLLALRRSRRPLSVPELMEATGIKRRTLYMHLSRLRASGLVERTWEGYRLRESRGRAYEAVFVLLGLAAVLSSVPLGDPALTVFGAVSIILARLAPRLA